MLKKLRKNNKKGFTLVELIVVLVILAILAALLVPALTGYIDKAKEKQIVAETRQIVMAAQTILDEKYGKMGVNESVTGFEDDEKKDIIKLTEIKDLQIVDTLNDTDENKTVITIDTSSAKISKVEYRAHGLKCTYDIANGTDYVVE